MERSAVGMFIGGLGLFTTVVAQVSDHEWRRPTPCGTWVALDVLGHVGGAVGFGTELLQGGSASWEPPDPPSSAVAGEPAKWWQAVMSKSRDAVKAADPEAVVETQWGSRSLRDGLAFPTIDLFVHAWDLAAAIGSKLVLPEAAIAFARDYLSSVPEERLRNERVFGPAVALPPGADPSSAFIAWTGRDPHWTPPSDSERGTH